MHILHYKISLNQNHVKSILKSCHSQIKLIKFKTTLFMPCSELITVSMLLKEVSKWWDWFDRWSSQRFDCDIQGTSLYDIVWCWCDDLLSWYWGTGVVDCCGVLDPVRAMGFSWIGWSCWVCIAVPSTFTGCTGTTVVRATKVLVPVVHQTKAHGTLKQTQTKTLRALKIHVWDLCKI